MEDIRIRERQWKFLGKTWKLRCNMNVLADVQDAYGGNISTAIKAASIRSYQEFLAAMLNDWADEQGWAERFTRRQIGRLIDRNEFMDEIVPMVRDLVVAELSSSEADEDADQEKN